MTTTSNFHWLKPLALAFALGAMAAPATAQVVVYKMSFKPLRSFNLDFYDSGYFVAPLTNTSSSSSTTSTSGTKSGSFIFTVTKTRPYLYTASGTGQVFTVVKKDGSAHWVVRADNASSGSSTGGTDTGTSGAASGYLAFGPVMKRMTFSGSTYKIKMSVPTHLKGGAVASSDESGDAEGRTTDIGFASTFEWKLQLDEEQTSAANTAGHDVAATITMLTGKLESRGFTDENAPVDNNDDGTDTGTDVSITR